MTISLPPAGVSGCRNVPPPAASAELWQNPRLCPFKILHWTKSKGLGACGFAFADGHSEMLKWRDVALTILMGHGPSTPAPNSKDAYWIMGHSTRTA